MVQNGIAHHAGVLIHKGTALLPFIAQTILNHSGKYLLDLLAISNPIPDEQKDFIYCKVDLAIPYYLRRRKASWCRPLGCTIHFQLLP